jgi:hypothetical protein
MAKKAGRRGRGGTKRPKKGQRRAAAGKRTRRLARPRRPARAAKRTAKKQRASRAPARTARRTAGGFTNPMPTKRSTGTAAGAGASGSPRLERERRRLRDIEESVPGPPSSLSVDRHASAAQTGRRELREALHEHTETSPALTGGDIDADWEDAYAVGDEAPGGDNPTPDQDRVDDIGRALGVEYEDAEELKGAKKIEKRDRNRWELDPASAEDYKDRK